MEYKKLLGLSMAVVTIGGYVFNFNQFNSKDSLIKQGVDRIKAIAEQYRTDLETLQSEYDTLMGDLSSTQDALEQARIKLQQIYQKITGNTWDEANGDILDFDFNTLIKDSDQYEHNVNGAEISKVLGIPEDSSTEDIINAINDLIATVQSLEQQIETLNSRITSLEAEIQEYQTEQDSLVEEINGLKAKLDAATAEANTIIDGASAEEQAQLDYINETLTELGGEAVEDDGEVIEPVEPEEPELTPYEEAYNNLSSDKLRDIVDAGYKPEYLGNYTTQLSGGYHLGDNNTFNETMLDLGYVEQETNSANTTVKILVMSTSDKAELDAFYNEYMAQ